MKYNNFAIRSTNFLTYTAIAIVSLILFSGTSSALFADAGALIIGIGLTALGFIISILFLIIAYYKKEEKNNKAYIVILNPIIFSIVSTILFFIKS